MNAQAHRQAGFTLIEMLVVMLFTAVLMISAVGFYLQIARASTSAAEATGDVRRAVAAVDRVARDLEGATLVKKPDAVDPLAHPWLFLAEAGVGGTGAERLKFDSRNHVPRASALHESDLAVVAYFLAPDDSGDGFVLLRWTSPRLPPALNRDFPRADDPGVERFVDGVASFGVRLLGEEGEWADAWDSSTLAQSSQLPVAAEVSLALRPAEGDPRPPELFVRQVVMPQRPLDLEALLAGEDAAEGEEDEDDEDRDCVTVDQCIAANPGAFQLLLGANPDLAAVIDSIRGQCYRDHAASLAVQVEGCD